MCAESDWLIENDRKQGGNDGAPPPPQILCSALNNKKQNGHVRRDQIRSMTMTMMRKYRYAIPIEPIN
jgi:hypothetical protein